MRIAWAACLALYPITPAGASAAEPPPLQMVVAKAPHMGTVWSITLYAKDKETGEKAAAKAFERVAALELVMSDYTEKSELMKLCLANDAHPGEPVKISAELMDVLRKSQEIAATSDGAFDVTVGPLSKLWRTARKTKTLPDSKELAAARELVGYKMLTLDPKAETATLSKAGMRLDLGGIGKGYAADEALKVLKEQGIESALVAASGDIAVSGAPPGKPAWIVDIAPLNPKDEPRRLALVNAAVSTSGDLFQHVEIAGTRYSHVLDPKTGLGLTGYRSATVIAKEGWRADALTKTASVLPPDKALALIGKIEGTAMFVATKASHTAEEMRTQSKTFADYEAK